MQNLLKKCYFDTLRWKMYLETIFFFKLFCLIGLGVHFVSYYIKLLLPYKLTFCIFNEKKKEQKKLKKKFNVVKNKVFEKNGQRSYTCAFFLRIADVAEERRQERYAEMEAKYGKEVAEQMQDAEEAKEIQETETENLPPQTAPLTRRYFKEEQK